MPAPRHDSSAPRTSDNPGGLAAAAGRPPAVVSWSVIATTSSPAAAAAVISSAGVSVPSLAVEWACRSMRFSIAADATGSAFRLRTQPGYEVPARAGRRGHVEHLARTVGLAADHSVVRWRDDGAVVDPDRRVYAGRRAHLGRAQPGQRVVHAEQRQFVTLGLREPPTVRRETVGDVVGPRRLEVAEFGQRDLHGRPFGTQRGKAQGLFADRAPGQPDGGIAAGAEHA